MAQLSTYSALDTNGNFSIPGLGVNIPFAGINKAGIGQINVRMTTDHSVIQQGMDGAQVPSYVPGAGGHVEIQVWQNRVLHDQVLEAYNLIKSAADTGDVSNAFGGTMFIQNTVDQTSHTCSGVGISKPPDKGYGGQSALVSWMFPCCNIVNE